MTEMELKMVGGAVALLLWGLLVWGSCDCRRSELEEYRFGYEFYREQYDLIANEIYTEQKRQAIQEKFDGEWREHMTQAGYPPVKRKG